MNNTIITYGTFDLFHRGHVQLLKRLKSMGNKVVVGLSTDAFNLVKGKKSVYDYNHRKELLEACKYVDKVFPEDTWEQKVSDIKRENANLFVMGDDWSGKFDYLKEHVEVIYLSRTPEISTTEIKSYLREKLESRDKELIAILSKAIKILENT